MSTPDAANTRPQMSTRVDSVLQEMIQQAVADGPYMDESEFHREALRAHLRRMNGGQP